MIQFDQFDSSLLPSKKISTSADYSLFKDSVNFLLLLKGQRLRFRRGEQQILQFLSFSTSSIPSNSDSIKIVKIRLVHESFFPNDIQTVFEAFRSMILSYPHRKKISSEIIVHPVASVMKIQPLFINREVQNHSVVVVSSIP